ncbi:YbjQ family protein [Tsukamurella soli]|uniref:YbjQ family protein n=1 Tax=Tsukamurella soli TaxID=644556 RepID=UPI00361559F4
MGEVFGLTVRSRNAFSNMGAGFKAMAGGELKGLTKLLHDSREEALSRMCQEAMARGANAVVAMRFDCNELGGTASEIAAYGTAVYIVPAQPRPPQYQGGQQYQGPPQGRPDQSPPLQGPQQGQQNPGSSHQGPRTALVTRGRRPRTRTRRSTTTGLGASFARAPRRVRGQFVP